MTGADPQPVPAERQGLAAAGVYEVAVLYEALGRLGVTPREADRMYLWECAMVLGVGRPGDDGKPGAQSKAARRARGRELLRARAQAAQGRGEGPEARPVDASTLPS